MNTATYIQRQSSRSLISETTRISASFSELTTYERANQPSPFWPRISELTITQTPPIPSIK